MLTFPLPSGPRFSRVLALGSHADDIEIGGREIAFCDPAEQLGNVWNSKGGRLGSAQLDAVDDLRREDGLAVSVNAIARADRPSEK